MARRAKTNMGSARRAGTGNYTKQGIARSRGAVKGRGPHSVSAGEAGPLGLRIAADHEQMSRMAADFIIGELEKRRDLLLCVSAGGTPTLAYQMLGAERARRRRLFERLRVLLIDEWSGLASGHPASCRAELRTGLLDPLGIGPDRCMGFRGDAADPERECVRISGWLAVNGPIDVCVLGLGANGHVALNEPADGLYPFSHQARLAGISRRHPMIRSLDPKPSHGLTLGLGEILGSRRIFLLVSGSRKRKAVARLMEPKVTSRFPASFLWLHRDVTMFCDADAAAGLAERRRLT